MSPEELAKSILMLQYGIGAFCVLITLFLFFQVFKFVYEVKNKETKKEKDDNALQMAALEEALHENVATMNKLKLDLNRYYTALKLVAGNRWAPEIKPFLDDEGKN